MERSITFEARVVGGQKERNQRLEVGSAIEGYAEHCDCGDDAGGRRTNIVRSSSTEARDLMEWLELSLQNVFRLEV